MKVSVVTPSFRQLDWLQLCISSVADQEGAEVEHIVQDGGTEGFSEFAKQMAKRWPDRPGYRRVMVSEKDKGMYDAINRGFEKARGSIYAYLNCDEQYLPGTLSLICHWFSQHPGIEILHGDVIVTNPGGEYLCHRKALIPKPAHTVVSGSLSFFTAATFFRSCLWKEGFVFNPAWKVVGDAEWAWRLLAGRRRFGLCHQYLSTFTDTGNNLALSSKGNEERKRWGQQAPWWVRLLRPAIVALYRVEKWTSGGYRVTADPFRIYRLSCSEERTTIFPRHPTFRWRNHGP